MATATPTKLLTAEEFMAADLGEGTFELVRGEIVEMPPAMPEHGRVCVNVVFVLESYGRQTGYGYALSNDSAVVTERNPDTVRGADVCFYSHARWPRAQVGNKLPPVPPDVASKWSLRETARGKIMKKVANTSKWVCPLVWVVYPKRGAGRDLSRIADDRRCLSTKTTSSRTCPSCPDFVAPVATSSSAAPVPRPHAAASPP